MITCCPVCSGFTKKTIKTYDGFYNVCSICELHYISDIHSREEIFVDFSTVGSQLYSKISCDSSFLQLSPAEEYSLNYIKNKNYLFMEIKELFAEIGRLSFFLNKIGYHVVASDPLETHVSLLNKVGIKTEGLLEVPVNSEKIGLVIIIESIVRLKNPLEFLSNLHLTYPSADILITAPSLKRSVLSPLNNSNAYRPPHQLTRWNEKALRTLLTSAGYMVVKEKNILLDFNMTRFPMALKKLIKLFFILMGEGAYSHFIVGKPVSK